MREYAALAQLLRDRLGLDLGAYRSDSMERRVQAALHRMGVSRLEDFLARARQDPSLLKDLVGRLTIHVSEFFRNPELFAVLERQILPELRGRFGALRVWSAGCSNGAEAYSVAMLLAEADPKGGWSVLGTDVDPTVLEQAEEGRYRDADVRHVDPRRRARFFVREGEFWRVRPELRQRVRFRRHDLLADPFGGPWHLVLCRNVVIYFTEDAKRTLYRRFVAALETGGYLFVGAAEQVLGAREMGLESASPFFYRKFAGGDRAASA